MQKIKVVIVDDHPLVINGIEKMLHRHAHISIVATYTSPQLFIYEMNSLNFDILLLDIQMPEMTGDVLLSQINVEKCNFNIIALTGFDAPQYLQTMMNNGCKGYVLKNATETTIIHAIETVHRNEVYIQPSLRDAVLLQYLKQDQIEHDIKQQITEKEIEVLRLIMEEKTSIEIATELFMSPKTVEKYRTNLMNKLQVKNTAGLVKQAIKLKIIEDY